MERELDEFLFDDPTLMDVKKQVQALEEYALKANQNSIQFQNTVFQDFGGKILSNDLILLSAKTGAGN